MTALLDRWTRFWFAPTDGATLAAVRIAFGVVVTLWALSVTPDLHSLFSYEGIVDGTSSAHDWRRWSVLDLAPSTTAVTVLLVVLVLAGAATAAGWHTRASTAVVLVALVSLQRTNPYVFNSGDVLLRLLALYLLLSPAGRVWSLDRRRAARRRRSPPPAEHAAWPLRLIQLQVCLMYVASVWTKLHGELWREGTAASFAIRLPDLQRFDLAGALAAGEIGAQLLTYGALAVEAALVVLIWPRRTRPYALAAGAGLHLSIDLSLRVGFFGLAILTAYLSFADPARVRAVAGALARVRIPPDRRRTGTLAREAAAPLASATRPERTATGARGGRSCEPPARRPGPPRRR